MKKTFVIGYFLVAAMLAGAGCAMQSNVDATGMMKTSAGSAMTDETKTMKADNAMQNDSEAMMKKDGGSAEAEIGVKTDAGVMIKKDGDAMMKKEPVAPTAGTYEAYSTDKLALAKEGSVVLFFKAGWCPTCKAVDADILAHLSAIPVGTHILIVDYDTSAELKKKYGVTYQHTFVQVDPRGTMLKKWSGSPTLASLVAEIK